MDNEKTVPEKIFDSTLKGQINIDKYGVELNNEMQKLLKKTQDEIVSLVAKYDPTSPNMTKWKLARLENLNEQISEVVGKSFEEIKKAPNRHY